MHLDKLSFGLTVVGQNSRHQKLLRKLKLFLEGKVKKEKVSLEINYKFPSSKPMNGVAFIINQLRKYGNSSTVRVIFTPVSTA